MKYLIVGVDPGITSAVAILDLEGNLIHVESGKRLGVKRIAEIISKYGRPVIITTDVMYAPEMVKKLASLFNSKIVLPPRNLRVGEKKRIVSEFGAEVEDDHQRDSLAAAILACRKYEPLFIKVEKVLSEEGKLNEAELVKKKLILGEANSIRDALKKKEVPEEYRELMVEAKKDKKIERLENEIKKLKEVNELLKKRKEELEKELERVKANAEKTMFKKFEKKLRNKDYTIRSLEEVLVERKIENLNLKKEIENLNKKIEMIMRGYTPVIRVKNIREILKLDNSAYGHFIIVEEPYTKLSKNVKRKIDELNLKLGKGKTFKVGDFEFLESEEEDVVEKIQDLIEKWRKREL